MKVSYKFPDKSIITEKELIELGFKLESLRSEKVYKLMISEINLDTLNDEVYIILNTYYEENPKFILIMDSIDHICTRKLYPKSLKDLGKVIELAKELCKYSV